MQIEINAILNVNNNLYKVYGETKLFWLVHPYQLLEASYFSRCTELLFL